MNALRRRGLIPIIVITITIVAAVAPALAQTSGPPSGSGVQPQLVPDNPKCADDLGYAFHDKVEPVASGTYTLGDGLNTFTLSVYDTPDGPAFDWTSTLSLDFVIVKGGDNANLYEYDPEATGDTYLHAPVNPSNGKFYGLSHVEICFDYEVTVAKTAETTFTRTYSWDIEKSVDVDTWSLFAGQTGTSNYAVTATKTGYTDSGWAVEGTVTISNDTPYDATITGVSDAVSGFGAVALECGAVFPLTLVAGSSMECTYASPLPDGTTRVNTATVVTTGIVGGGEATADVIFGVPTTTVNDTVNVTDTNGMSWGPVAATTTWNYSKDFPCSSNPDDYSAGQLTYGHDNTATIVETGHSDNEHVTVRCYAAVVSKTAATELKRTWSWTVEKAASHDSLTLSLGQVIAVTYGVTVDATSQDSDWKVSGVISVHNPHPTETMAVALGDEVSGGIAASLDCGSSLSIPPGGTSTCGYSAWLPDGSDRTNVATATLNGVAFTGSAAVEFAGATVTEVDECVDVTDDQWGDLGTVCCQDAPHTFQYTMDVGPYDACGRYEVSNTAGFVTNDTGTTGSDTVVIPVNVPCEGGCTLTPGYWKTHSVYGPAPYDDTWAQIGEDTPFFLSGQSYYEVLWTQPRGNAYYILAHAYIAAELNWLNGASAPPEVQDAFDEATAIFDTYTPDDVAKMKGRNGTQLRAVILGYATMLDDYNNGLVGPGHCSE